jgi:hypothetical protein
VTINLNVAHLAAAIEETSSDRRPHLLKKIANSLYQPPPAEEPDISKHVEEAIELLDRCKVSAPICWPDLLPRNLQRSAQDAQWSLSVGWEE